MFICGDGPIGFRKAHLARTHCVWPAKEHRSNYSCRPSGEYRPGCHDDSGSLATTAKDHIRTTHLYRCPNHSTHCGRTTPSTSLRGCLGRKRRLQPDTHAPSNTPCWVQQEGEIMRGRHSHTCGWAIRRCRISGTFRQDVFCRQRHRIGCTPPRHSPFDTCSQ